MHGYCLLQKGLIWRTVNGENLKVWQDNWIPSGSRRPLGCKCDTSVTRVSEFLLRESKEWNADLVTEVLYEPDANDTLQINVGKWDGHDFLARNWNTNGIFSVKSAYKLRRYEHFTISMDNWGGFSSNVENHKGWLKLWSMNAPEKMKIHAWHIALRSVDVGAELARRKIKFIVRCP